MSLLRFTPEQFDALQARIKSQCAVREVRPMEVEHAIPPRGPDKSPRKSGSGVYQRKSRAKPDALPRKERARLGGLAANRNRVPEATVMAGCIAILDSHPKVALWWRQNTGGMENAQGRYIKFSFKGASDLMGVSTSGRFIAVECKATGKKATDEQRNFLENVADAGGFAVCVDDPAKLASALETL